MPPRDTLAAQVPGVDGTAGCVGAPVLTDNLGRRLRLVRLLIRRPNLSCLQRQISWVQSGVRISRSRWRLARVTYVYIRRALRLSGVVWAAEVRHPGSLDRDPCGRGQDIRAASYPGVPYKWGVLGRIPHERLRRTVGYSAVSGRECAGSDKNSEKNTLYASPYAAVMGRRC